MYKNLILLVLFLSIGCGDKTVEDVLDPVFVMDRQQAKPTTIILDETSDKEEEVLNQLATLKDEAEFSLEKDQGSFSKALKYVYKVISRSNLVPVEKRSSCQCQYAYTTFYVAVETYGELLLKLKNQDIEKWVKKDLAKYQKIKGEWEDGIVNMREISEVKKPELLVKEGKEIEEIEKITKKAKEYVTKLQAVKKDDAGEKKEDKKSDDKSKGKEGEGK